MSATAVAPRAAADSAAAPTSSAAAFHDSVGVVVHVSYFDTPYDQWDRVIAKLRELGVARIRDGLFVSASPGWNTTVYDRLNAAALNGLKLDLVVPLGCSSQGTIAPCLSALKTRLAVNAVDTLEWPNEADASGDPDWAADLRAWGRELYFPVKVDPALSSIDVIGPSLVALGSRTELGDQSQALDLGNVHPYTGATSPNPFRMFDEHLLASRVSGSKPLVATEAGFHTAAAATNGDQPGADERTAAIYTLRTVLEHYADDVRATYLYELLDERADPRDSQSNYGPSVWDRDASEPIAVAPKRYTIWVPGITGYAAGDPVVFPYLLPGAPDDGLVDALVGADPLVIEIRR